MGEAKRRKALPSLADWLATMIESADPAARDDFAAFRDWVGRMLEHTPIEDRRQAMMLRMVQAASLAIVESCNWAEDQGTEPHEVMGAMCRSLGVSFGYALMSLSWKDDAPIRSLAKPMGLEFEMGLKYAIDECLRSEEAAAP